MTYVRPDESARLSYDLIKSGQFEKAILQGMAAARRPGARRASQDHQPGQAPRFLGLRQVPLPGRRLQHHGRRRPDHDRLHPPEEQPVIASAGRPRPLRIP